MSPCLLFRYAYNANKLGIQTKYTRPPPASSCSNTNRVPLTITRQSYNTHTVRIPPHPQHDSLLRSGDIMNTIGVECECNKTSSPSPSSSSNEDAITHSCPFLPPPPTVVIQQECNSPLPSSSSNRSAMRMQQSHNKRLE